jgi:hypothetical protein
VNALIADVNWLLSALAQSSAALIAIVGGLLVSRYVALHAEQEAAKRRLADLDRRLVEADISVGEAERSLAQHAVDDLLESEELFEHLLRAQGEELTVELALEALDADPEDYDAAVLKDRVAFFFHEWSTAVSVLFPLIPDSEEQVEWLEFRRGRDLPVGSRYTWSWVYDKIVVEKVDKARKERQRAERAARQKQYFGNLVQPVDYSSVIGSLRDPALTAAYRISDSQHELAKVSDLRARVSETTVARAALRQERRLAAETYDATRQPAGFVLALQVLTILAACGLVVPVVIMGFGPMTLEPWARAAVIAVFIVGLGLLLRFLYVYASYLRADGRADLPRSVVGLLRK